MMKLAGLFIFGIIIINFSSPEAFAINPNGSDPIGDIMCDVSRMLRNWWALPVATIAIMVVAFYAFKGHISWQIALIVMTGIILIMSAHTLVGYFATDQMQEVCNPHCTKGNPYCPGGVD